MTGVTTTTTTLYDRLTIRINMVSQQQQQHYMID